MKVAGVSPDLRGYNLALKACESGPGRGLRQDQLLIALSIHDELRKLGLPRDAYTYSTLLGLCAQVGRRTCWLLVFEFFADIVQHLIL